MRAVSSAICTSADPVSASARPCLPTISSFASLVRVIASFRRLRSPSPPRGRTRTAETAVGRKGSNEPFSGVFARDGATADQAAMFHVRRRSRPPGHGEAGIEILEDGGSAADAAVAACLASCVAETVMTGLLGGGHAIFYDAATGQRAESRLLRRRAGPRRGAGEVELLSSTSRSAWSSCTTRSGSPPAACPGCRRGSARSARRTDGSPGSASSSRRCGWRARASSCRRPTRRAWRCSRRS